MSARSFFLSFSSLWRSDDASDPFEWTRAWQADEAAGTWLIDMDLVSALGAARERAEGIVAAARLDESQANGIDGDEFAAAQAFIQAFANPASFSELLHLLADTGGADPAAKPDSFLPVPTGASIDAGADAVITAPPRAEPGEPSANIEPPVPDVPSHLLPARLPPSWARFGMAAQQEEGGARFSLEMPMVDDKTLMGEVSLDTLGADLEALIGDGLIGLEHSRLIAVSSGDLAGKLFMVFERNGEAGFQADADEVYLVAPGLPPPDLSADGAGL